MQNTVADDDYLMYRLPANVPVGLPHHSTNHGMFDVTVTYVSAEPLTL